jgi:phosphatidate phosphatase APP1
MEEQPKPAVARGASPKPAWPAFPRLRELVARRRDPAIILPYLGYGTSGKLTLSGRVLQDEGFRPTRDSERRWRNLAAFVKRMESDEIPGARLRASFAGMSVETTSDSEGYFGVEFEAPGLPAGWHEIQLELLDHAASGIGKVLVPAADAEFGVISDIDDTVVESDVTRKLRMLVKLALSNAHTRKPFEGVAAFYRALHRDRNPFFYVSKSPHNLYSPLMEFLHHQQLPPGPLLLRDFGVRMRKDHKAVAMEKVLTTYPALPFILIGDSGEHDPEIYAGILKRFPERIRVIYIRSIDRSPARLKAIEKLVEEVAATGCQLVLAADSEFAATHAAAEGLIPTAELSRVRLDKKADEKAT